MVSNSHFAPGSIGDHLLRAFNGRSLGTYTGGESVETAFPLAFCKAVSPVQDATSTRPFRFVFLSGTFVRTDQDESLWFGSVTRKAKVWPGLLSVT